MKVNNKTNSGFTLVELAIVIVIIGLLVGGVLQGQELIKQAQIRSAMSTIQGYNAAINTFRAKYNEMPGDISRASTFGLNAPKGGGTANAAATSATAVTATAGGDGNGNGTLEAVASNAITSNAAALFNGEVSNFWTHLGNAQLVKGTYAYSATPVVGTNYPSMPVGTGIVAASASGLTYWVTGIPGSLTLFGGTSAATSLVPTSTSATMSPSEAFGIDGKLDDGSPFTGIIQAVSAYSAANAFTVQVAGASSCNFTGNVYNIAGTSADSKICTIIIRADG